MGFNKRFVTESTIMEFLDGKKTIEEIYSCDAIIGMDEISTEVFKLYQKKTPTEEIIKVLNKIYGRPTA
jgi:hypothetical protein